MGYDMSWVRKDDDEDAAVANARVVWEAAIAARNAIPKSEHGTWDKGEYTGALEEVPANASDRYRHAQLAVAKCSRAMDKAERSYFRLNIWGMGRYRTVMEELGALRVDYSQEGQPGFPDNIPDDYWEWDDEGAVMKDAGRLAYFDQVKQQMAEWRSWSPEGPVSGIPVHKLCSNDGWLVTSEECFYAAETIRAFEPAHVIKVLRSHDTSPMKVRSHIGRIGCSGSPTRPSTAASPSTNRLRPAGRGEAPRPGVIQLMSPDLQLSHLIFN